MYINNAISDEENLSDLLEKMKEAEQTSVRENTALDRSIFGGFIVPIR